MSKPINTKNAFVISFTSIIIFCLLILFSLFAYRQIKLFSTNKNYQQCLADQIQADKVALSYIPTIKQLSVTKNHLFIKGVINNLNIDNLVLISWMGGDDNGLVKTFKYDKNNGNFSYEITTSMVAFNPNFNMQITLKDTSKLSQIYIETTPANGNWCLGGSVDLGLGSAPIGELSDTELKTIGLSKNNICHEGTGGIRASKCTKASPTSFLPL